MKRILSGHRKVYLFIVISSVMVMAMVANLPFRIKPFGDLTFHEESRDLAFFLKGELSAASVQITKAPGPVLFYTPAYFLAPSPASDTRLWINGVIMTTVLLTVSMMLLFRAAVTIFSRKIALLTIALFLIFPIHAYYSLGIVGEVPAFFSLALAIYGWAKCLENPGRKRGYWLIGLGLLLLMLNRPNSVFILLTIPLILIYAYFKAKPFFYRHVRSLAVLFVLVIALGMGMLKLAKNISGSQHSDSQENLLYYVLHEGRFQFREEPLDWRFWDGDNRPDSRDHANWKKSHAQLHQIMKDSNRAYKDVYREWLIADAIEHPWYFTRQFFVKIIFGHVYIINSLTPQKFAIGPFQGPAAYYALHVVINLVNLAIMVGSVLFLFRERNHLRVWLLWSAILSLIVFHALSYMEPRYLFPSKAALYMLAAAGLARVPIIGTMLTRADRFFYPENHTLWQTQDR